jgi:hypothetical protein
MIQLSRRYATVCSRAVSVTDTALEHTVAERDAAQEQLQLRQDDLQKCRSELQKKSDLCHTVVQVEPLETERLTAIAPTPRRPRQKALLVVKNSLTTGTTVGRVNGVFHSYLHRLRHQAHVRRGRHPTTSCVAPSPLHHPRQDWPHRRLAHRRWRHDRRDRPKL